MLALFNLIVNSNTTRDNTAILQSYQSNNQLVIDITFNHSRIFSNSSILLRLPAVSMSHTENCLSKKSAKQDQIQNPALLVTGQSVLLTHLSGART